VLSSREKDERAKCASPRDKTTGYHGRCAVTTLEMRRAECGAET